MSFFPIFFRQFEHKVRQSVEHYFDSPHLEHNQVMTLLLPSLLKLTHESVMCHQSPQNRHIGFQKMKRPLAWLLVLEANQCMRYNHLKLIQRPLLLAKDLTNLIMATFPWKTLAYNCIVTYMRTVFGPHKVRKTNILPVKTNIIASKTCSYVEAPSIP